MDTDDYVEREIHQTIAGLRRLSETLQNEEVTKYVEALIASLEKVVE
jgi:hypothetical protein